MPTKYFLVPMHRIVLRFCFSPSLSSSLPLASAYLVNREPTRPGETSYREGCPHVALPPPIIYFLHPSGFCAVLLLPTAGDTSIVHNQQTRDHAWSYVSRRGGCQPRRPRPHSEYRLLRRDTNLRRH